MKIFFTHTHQFLLFNKKYYSTGGITNTVVDRYAKYCEKISFGVRVKYVNELNSSKLSEVSNDKLKFVNLNYNSKLFHKVKECVIDADFIVARLPSVFGLVAIYYAKKYDKIILSEVVGNSFNALWYHSFKGKLLAIPFEIATKRAIKNSNYVSYITNIYLQQKYPTKGAIASGLANITIPDTNFKDDFVLKKRLQRIEVTSVLKFGLIANLEVKYKGHHSALLVFCRLLKIYPNIKLDLVGGGSPVIIKNIIHKLGIGHAVSILGTIPNEKINDWLDTVDVYLQPSKTEGHGRAVIEAMSRGCTVVASNVGGMKETVEKDYRFESRNNSDFFRVISRVLEDSSLRKNIAVLNYNRSKEFAVSRINKKRTSFFKEIFKN